MKVKATNTQCQRGAQLPAHERHRFVTPASPAQSITINAVTDSHNFATRHHQNLHRHSVSASISDYYSDNEPSSSIGACGRNSSSASASFVGANEAAAMLHKEHHSSTHANDHRHVDAADAALLRSSRFQSAIELIVLKCESLSEDNERLVHRLHYVKKITKRKERDVAILKRRLDVYNDGWRTAQPEPLLKPNMPTLIPADNNVIVRKKYKKREKTSMETPTQVEQSQRVEMEVVAIGSIVSLQQQQQKQQYPAPNINDVRVHRIATHIMSEPVTATADCTAAEIAPRPTSIIINTTKGAKEPKRKRPKGEREKDPNAPKRPANPFFQFCQEQRSILMGELNSGLLPGQPELSKQELTRQLANRWRSLDSDNKQIYINMYENSKLKYNEEMQCYRDGRAVARRPTATVDAVSPINL